MSESKWKLEILARRAAYCAAALAATGAVGCDKKDKPSQMCLSVAPTFDSEVDPKLLPALCLSGTIGPASSKPSVSLDQPYPFVIKADGVDLEGTILAKVDGPTVPHAAEIAAGAHMRARTRTCFIEAVREGRKVEGTAEVTLEVRLDGTVTRATTSGTLEQKLRDCIAENAKKVGFNPIDNGTSSKVIVQMSFPKKG